MSDLGWKYSGTDPSSTPCILHTFCSINILFMKLNIFLKLLSKNSPFKRKGNSLTVKL